MFFDTEEDFLFSSYFLKRPLFAPKSTNRVISLPKWFPNYTSSFCKLYAPILQYTVAKRSKMVTFCNLEVQIANYTSSFRNYTTSIRNSIVSNRNHTTSFWNSIVSNRNHTTSFRNSIVSNRNHTTSFRNSMVSNRNHTTSFWNSIVSKWSCIVRKWRCMFSDLRRHFPFGKLQIYITPRIYEYNKVDLWEENRNEPEGFKCL